MLVQLYELILTSLFYLLVSSSFSEGHDETSSLESSDSSMEDYRRTFSKREWQYEGLPIEFPIQDIDNALQEEKTEPTTVILPPMSPRFRRIYNPDESADIRDYPFMAALLMNKKLWCGAAVIDTDTVLTAAHCLQLQYNNRFFREYVKMLTVRVGSTNATSGGELYHVAGISFHPNYKPQTLDFNFAILKLHKNISFGRDDVKVDMIPYSRERVVAVDKKITFLGWGSVLGLPGDSATVHLQKVELPVYDLADCQEIYGRSLVTRSHFCAGYITIPKNVCNHDAGGPAILDGELVGILSFSSVRCDEPDRPAVFSTVGVVAGWLEEAGKKSEVLEKKSTE